MSPAEQTSSVLGNQGTGAGVSATKEERCYPIGKTAPGQLSAPFHEGSLVLHATGMETRFKREPGPASWALFRHLWAINSLFCIRSCSQGLLPTKKVSLSVDCCPVKSTGCFRALGKPCRVEGTDPATHFLSDKDQDHWSPVNSQPGSQHSYPLALVASTLPLCTLCLHWDK